MNTATVKRAHLIANKKSGQGKGSTLAEEAKKVCDELGVELVDYDIKSPEDFERQSKAAMEAAKADGGVVIAAGGDGTIRGVAEVVQGTGVKFGVVACGTFNFFARNHRIPEDHLEAFRLALTGENRPVRLGEVNGRIFLINASLGLYAKAIQEREARTAKFGRFRVVVIISTILSMLSKRLLLRVELITKGITKSVRTPMIFVGSNALQLRGLKMDVALCMKQELLAVVMMKALSTWEVLGVILRGLVRRLDHSTGLETFCVDTMTIYTNQRWHKIALDGELFTLSSPLKIKALPEVLNMVLPPKAPTA